MPIALPSGLDPTLGVFLANVETALTIVLDAAPRLGERVVIFGQGVVGLLMTQLIRRTGAERLTVIDPIDKRRELALHVGASTALSPDELAALEVDIAIEASGNAAALNQAIDSLAFGGTVVVRLVVRHQARLAVAGRCVSSASAAHRQHAGVHHRRQPAAALDASTSTRGCPGAAGELDLGRLISHRFPLERAAEAYQLIDSTPEETVQVVLTYGSA